ncbi:MAG TPA: DUF3800 domain-containing protein [Longimicrobium sp.]|nr:DUF3800 domain-containing protein [Longimicrobium sp.]
MPSFSDYVVFVDESGDHGMHSIDPAYPVFVLALCLFEKEAYAGRAAPGVVRFKFKHFGHEQVILHEHEIRKTKGPFRFLFDTARRDPFYADLNRLITDSPFTLVASVIDKHRHRKRYAQPNNPYDISVGFGLERVFMHLKGLGCAGGTTHFTFEKRGGKEDADIEQVFRRVCEGANYTGERLPFEIVMADKKCNSAGLQIADLVARPIGRKTLDPKQPNRAYDLILPKFRRSPAGRIEGWGLEVFP